MNDQATLLKWAQQLTLSPNGKEACAKLLEAVSQQRLALPAIHEAGLLHPLCAALRSKEAPVQQRAVAVLLEASRCGPGGEVELAAASGCCQALLDLVATNMPTSSTVFEAAQQQQKPQQPQQDPATPQTFGTATANTTGAAAECATSGVTSQRPYSSGVRHSSRKQPQLQPQPTSQLLDRPAGLNAWEDPQQAARSACTLLWRISSEPEARELLMAGTSALVQVLMVLLGTPSVNLRMAASGALYNLSQATRVQAQLLSRAQELLPILIGLLSRAGPDLQSALTGGGSVGGGTCSPGFGIYPDSASASASGRTSPDVSPRHPALLAATAVPTTPQSVFSSPVHAARRASRTTQPQPSDALPQPQHSYYFQHVLLQAGNTGSSAAQGRSDGHGGGGGGSAGPWYSQPSSPFGVAPVTAAPGSAADAVAVTLAHVAGLLRVLSCQPSVATAMVAREGQPLQRLLRAMVQVGCSSALVLRTQPSAQSLLESLARFQLLCGSAVAALAGHGPLSTFTGVSVSSSSAASVATSGGAGGASGSAAVTAVAPAVMVVLYGCCCEADAAGLSVLAGNPGVTTALAMALQYGARALGVDVALPLLHPHAQASLGSGGPSAAGVSAEANVGVSISGGLGSAQGAVVAALPTPSGTASLGVSTDCGLSGVVAGGGGFLGASFPLDPAGSLRAAVFALHTLRVIASSAQATEALVAADCGALTVVRALSYFVLHRSMEQTTPLDEEAFAVQALASGTLARLAEQPAAQDVAVMREALAPPLEVLSALALLLLLPPAAPPPLVWGTGAGEAAAAASRSYVAALLAAIAQHGPYSYEVFTQVIVNTRGALGTIISFLPTPGVGLPNNRGERDSQQQVPTGPGPSETAAVASVASAAARPESAAVVGGRSAVGEPYEDAATAGVAAALALCTVAAHSRDVARVLAGKTTLVPTLLAVLRERRTVPSPAPESPGPNVWQVQGQGELRIKVLRLLCTLTTQLGEASVRSELVADSGLVPALVSCLGPQQPPGVVAAALEWLALLLQHPAFLQERMQGTTVNEFLARVLELLQLLPPSTTTAAGALTPSRAASLATLSLSGAAAPSAGSSVAGALAVAAAAATTPTSRTGRATPVAASVGASLRAGGSAHPARSEAVAGSGGSGSLNNSLRGGGLGRVGGASNTTVPPVAVAVAAAPYDLSAGSPAVAAAAAVALHRLAASGPALRNQLCAVPGLVAAVLRQVHGLLDQLEMDGYLLSAITATRLSALLAVLCALADSGAPSGSDMPLRLLHRRLSTLSSGSSRHYFNRRGSNMDEPMQPASRPGGLSASPGAGAGGAAAASGKPADGAAPDEPPAAGAGSSSGNNVEGNGSMDALRQMLDAPHNVDVLCEAIDAMHAVLEAEERARHARSAGAGGGGVLGGSGGVIAGGSPSSARSRAGGALGRVQAAYAGSNAAGSGVGPSTDPSGASPVRQHATTQGRTTPFSPGSRTSQWLGAESAQLEAAGTWQGSGAGSPWATRDSSPGAGAPLSPNKRRPQSLGGSLIPGDGVAGLLGFPFAPTTAPAQPPVERASPGQVADIRRHALEALQRLVGFWSAAARAEVELADAMPGLLAELELELQAAGQGPAGQVAAGSSLRSSLIASGGHDVLLLNQASSRLPQPPVSAHSSRPNRMAASLPPLPPPLPPPLGDVVMLSYGGGNKGSYAEGPSSSAAGASQPCTALLRRVVQVCCKLMVPTEPAHLRTSATAVVATVLSLSEELAAVMALTLPQLLDRLLDVISLLTNGGGGAIAVAANGGGAAVSAGGHGIAFVAGAGASIMRLDKQTSVGPVGCGGVGESRVVAGASDGGADGAVGELQDRLRLDAEACLTALHLLLQLASNNWAKVRLANHPRLAEALDALLDEDAVVTLRALLDAAALAQQQQLQQHGGLHNAGGQQQQMPPQPPPPQQPMQHGASDVGAGGGGVDQRMRQVASEGVGAVAGAAGGPSNAPPGASIMSLSLASSGSIMTTVSGPGTGIADVRALAAQLVADLAPHTSRSLLPPSGTGKGGLLSALDSLLREGSRGAQGLAVAALWALVSSPSGAASVGASGVPRSLVTLLRPSGGPAGPGHVALLGPAEATLRAYAVGVLAALVQLLDGAAAASLAAVEGLAGALLEVMAAAADLLARSVRHSSGSAGPAQGGSPKAAAGGGVFGGGGSGAFFQSSGELPDVAILEQAAHQLLWSITAVAGLSRSAAVAARFASLKALQPALLSALKIRPLDIQFYAASLVGNLAGHTATASVMAGVRGVGRELIRQLKETRLDPEGPFTELLLAALRNLASSERGRQELASDPATVPCLVRVLTAGWGGSVGGEGAVLQQQMMMAGAADASSRLLATQLTAAAALANLSGDRCGLEAMVADQELLLPPLWALARSLVVQAAPGLGPSGGGGAGGGEWVLNRGVNSRLRLFVCVLLANTMSHPVLAKTSLTLHDAMATLVALVLALPGPSRHAVQQDPLAPLRPRRQRMAAVAVLEALKQLLVAVGPRALHSLQGRPVKSTNIAATAAPAGGPGPLTPPAPGPGAPGSPARLARLVDHVMDLLAWVDFHSADEVASDPRNAGMGADVAGAAAGVVGQLAVLGVAGRFPEYAASSCQSLVKLLVLPTLQPLPFGQGVGVVPVNSAAPGVLDVAAGHAAAAVWALVSNPMCKAWGQQIRSDTAAHRVMMLLVRRGTRGGTRARFATARVFAATTLGQLAVQGGVSTSEMPDLLAVENGLPGALLDLATLALPNQQPQAQQQQQQQQQQQAQPGAGMGMALGGAMAGTRARGFGFGSQAPGPGMERHPAAAAGQGQVGAAGGGCAVGAAGAGGRQPRSKDVDPQEQVRAAALAMVGAAGDIRLTLGLQAVGALAHLAGERGGAPTLLQLPGLLDTASRLLSCPLPDVSGVAAMLLSTLSSAGGWQGCATMARTPGLVELLVAVLKSKDMQARAYCAVTLGNIANGPPPPSSPDLPPDTSAAATATAAMDHIVDSGALGCLSSMLEECNRLLELHQRRIRRQQQPPVASLQLALPIVSKPSFEGVASISPNEQPPPFLPDAASRLQYHGQLTEGSDGPSSVIAKAATRPGENQSQQGPNGFAGGYGKVGCDGDAGASTSEEATAGSVVKAIAAVESVQGPAIPTAISSLVVPLTTPQVAPLGSIAWPSCPIQRLQQAGSRQQLPPQATRSDMGGLSQGTGRPLSRFGYEAPKMATKDVPNGGDASTHAGQLEVVCDNGFTGPATDLNNDSLAALNPSLSAAAAAAGALQNLSAGHVATCAALVGPWLALLMKGEATQDDKVKSLGEWLPGSVDGLSSDAVDVEGHWVGLHHNDFLTTALQLLLRCYQLLNGYSNLETVLPESVLTGGGDGVWLNYSASNPLMLLLRLAALLLGILANLSANIEGKEALLCLLGSGAQAFGLQPAGAVGSSAAPESCSAVPCGHQSSTRLAAAAACDYGYGMHEPTGSAVLTASCIVGFVTLRLPAAGELLLTPGMVAGSSGAGVSHHASELLGPTIPRTAGGPARCRVMAAAEGMLQEELTVSLLLPALGVCCNLLMDECPHASVPVETGKEASFWDDAQALEHELSEACWNDNVQRSAVPLVVSNGAASIGMDSVVIRGPEELRYGSVVFQNDIGMMDGGQPDNSVGLAWPSSTADRDAITKSDCLRGPGDAATGGPQNWHETRENSYVGVPATLTSRRRLGQAVLLAALQQNASLQAALQEISVCTNKREQRRLCHFAGWLRDMCKAAPSGPHTM